jgi:hypothetical protein
MLKTEGAGTGCQEDGASAKESRQIDVYLLWLIKSSPIQINEMTTHQQCIIPA